MKTWTGSAPTADQAVKRGLSALRLTRDRVDIKILAEKSSFLLSLLGFRRVKVQLTEKSQPRDRWGRDRDRSRGRFERPAPRGNGKIEPSPYPSDRSDRERREHRRDRDDDRQRQDRREPVVAGARRRDTEPARRAPAPAPRAAKPSAPKETPGVFKDPIPLPHLLEQWKLATGWDDLSWTLLPLRDNVQPVVLKTSHADDLARERGRALEAFAYLITLGATGGRRELPRVSLTLEGTSPTDNRPPAEEPAEARDPAPADPLETPEDTRDDVPPAPEIREPAPAAAVDEKGIALLAQNAAEEVRRTGRVYRLDPMSPAERRVVHQTLAEEPGVETASEGEGPWRKVVVKPNPGKK
jgi:predicted RNA-binding protein Jag